MARPLVLQELSEEAGYRAWNSPHPQPSELNSALLYSPEKASSSGTWCDLNFNLTSIKSSLCSRLSIHLSHYSTEGMNLSALYTRLDSNDGRSGGVQQIIPYVYVNSGYQGINLTI